jgi:hypothetical protein
MEQAGALDDVRVGLNDCLIVASHMTERRHDGLAWYYEGVLTGCAVWM